MKCGNQSSVQYSWFAEGHFPHATSVELHISHIQLGWYSHFCKDGGLSMLTRKMGLAPLL